jgi:hypothetical protein
MFKVMFAIIVSWSKYIKISIMGIICCWLISVPFFFADECRYYKKCFNLKIVILFEILFFPWT